ncbi:hypothetical protein D3P07_00895 [Paenibacillus sp. 1011MAR3C5]|nr:hypothetical protein D3P07_00895 [Paenibacillus sp. 1011MAR3C5]
MTSHLSLTDDYVDYSANQPPTYQLGLIGNNPPFIFAVEGSFTPQDVFEFGEKRRHELLNEVRTLYNGDLDYDNTFITLTTRKGANNGVVTRYRKNLAGIVRKSHDMERITRLYGYGKNGLTIEGLPGYSVKYIDSQFADPAHIFEGSVDFPEIEDQARLLAEMQRYITTVELPKVSYEIDFVELEKVDAEFQSEAIREVGDTIIVIDESMGFRFDARITEYERYPFEPKRGCVVLANFREMKTSDYIFQATVGSRKAMVYTSENAVLECIKYDDSITLVDGLGMAVSDELNRVRVRLGQVEPGNYGFAAYNKAGKKTLWLDADTGDAQFSGNIIASNFRTNPDGFPFVELSSDYYVFKAAKSETSYIEIEAIQHRMRPRYSNILAVGRRCIPVCKAVDTFSLVSGLNYDIAANDGIIRIKVGVFLLTGV